MAEKRLAKVIPWPVFEKFSREGIPDDYLHQAAQPLYIVTKTQGSLLAIVEYEYFYEECDEPCCNCGQTTEVTRPKVRLYKASYKLGVDRKIGSTEILYAAQREVLRIFFAGGKPWCHRKTCQQNYVRILNWRG